MKRILSIALFVASALVCATQARAQVIVIANPGVKATEISKND